MKHCDINSTDPRKHLGTLRTVHIAAYGGGGVSSGECSICGKLVLYPHKRLITSPRYFHRFFSWLMF